jgi:hypothetical protein
MATSQTELAEALSKLRKTVAVSLLEKQGKTIPDTILMGIDPSLSTAHMLEEIESELELAKIQREATEKLGAPEAERSRTHDPSGSKDDEASPETPPPPEPPPVQSVSDSDKNAAGESEAGSSGSEQPTSVEPNAKQENEGSPHRPPEPDRPTPSATTTEAPRHQTTSEEGDRTPREPSQPPGSDSQSDPPEVKPGDEEIKGSDETQPSNSTRRDTGDVGADAGLGEPLTSQHEPGTDEGNSAEPEIKPEGPAEPFDEPEADATQGHKAARSRVLWFVLYLFVLTIALLLFLFPDSSYIVADWFREQFEKAALMWSEMTDSP